MLAVVISSVAAGAPETDSAQARIAIAAVRRGEKKNSNAVIRAIKSSEGQVERTVVGALPRFRPESHCLHKSGFSFAAFLDWRQGRRGFWRNTVIRRLFEGVSQFEQCRLAIRPGKESEPCRQVVAGESCRNVDYRAVVYERVQTNQAPRGLVRRVHSFGYEIGLVFDRLENNCVELILCHDVEDVDQQLFTSMQIGAVFGGIG